MKTLTKGRKLARLACATAVLSAVLATGMSAAPTLHAQTLPTDPAPTCIVDPVSFTTWFPGGVSLNGVVQPADSVAFPDAPPLAGGTANCQFYLWSQQMFLWLTSPTSSVFGDARTFNSNSFFTVSRLNPAGQRFFLANNPSSPPLQNTVNVELAQAQSNVALIAQNGSLVYYSIAVNDVFAWFVTGVKSSNIAATRFPTSQDELNLIVDFATLSHRTFANPQAMTMELKMSWIETTGLDTSKFVLMNAMVPTWDTTNPDHWVKTGSRMAQLAMIGMHVVGSVNNHPEMIWATYEHVDAAPSAAYFYVNARNGLTHVAQNTAGSWLLTANGASGPFNIPRQTYAYPDIVTTVPAVPIGLSDTLRQKAFGTASNNAESARQNAEVISINNSVTSQLLPGDVRANYRLIGATWTVAGAPPNATNQVGTNRLANSSMETYRQGHDSSSLGASNCFTCHTSNSTAVSLIYDSLQALNP